ncbi:MAG: T9SS type A sorting domain-containing protein, partial [Bacteroidales bacterium]|nr:T9SS type A sorting domain-containing protein [Bacteroidales bacterium]
LDQNGRLVNNGNILSSQIDVTDLANGFYFLTINCENEIFRTKFIKFDY